MTSRHPMVDRRVRTSRVEQDGCEVRVVFTTTTPDHAEQLAAKISEGIAAALDIDDTGRAN